MRTIEINAMQTQNSIAPVVQHSVIRVTLIDEGVGDLLKILTADRTDYSAGIF